MKKQLNVDQIQSELRGGSAFFPSYKGGDSPTMSSQVQKKGSQVHDSDIKSTPLPESNKPATESSPIPERVNARTPVRSNGKRIITRNSFETYEDQMDSLRKLSFQEKMEGKLGSMSQMVREAIDDYLEKRKISRK